MVMQVTVDDDDDDVCGSRDFDLDDDDDDVLDDNRPSKAAHLLLFADECVSRARLLPGASESILL